MPRKQRLHVPGGFYHVILRGNCRQPIFFDVDDRHRWELLLSTGLSRYGHRIHAYCWMTNHVHMALQCRTEPVSRLVRFVASQYARSTNRKMNRSGHLFERRHRLILVQADRYLQTLVRYIHQNPLRAGIVNNLEQYEWSSHRAYMGGSRPDWLTVDWVLGTFGSVEQLARRCYREFMQHDTDSAESTLFSSGVERDCRILGDDGFGEKAICEAGSFTTKESLDSIVARLCDEHGVSEAMLASKSRVRKHVFVRAQIALLAIDSDAATLATIARRFARSESVISRSVTRLRANKAIRQ